MRKIEFKLNTNKLGTSIKKDTYTSFEYLAAHETAGRDFSIEFQEQAGSKIIIIALHGGGIEKNTSNITKQIASDVFSYYCFSGIKPKGNQILHVTMS